MKLLLINYEFPPIGGGAATATKELAESLCRRGCDVTVVTSKAKQTEKNQADSPYKIYRLWTGRRHAESCSLFEMAMFVLVCTLFLPFLLAKEKFDGSVLFFGLPCGWFGPLLKIVFKVPYVVSLRGGDVPGNEPSLNNVHHFLSPFRRYIYRHAKCVTANSEGLKKKSQQADPHSVLVIPNGVDCHRFHVPPSVRSAANRILFIGRLVEQKNVHVLLLAFGKLNPQARLDIIGDGPLRNDLESLARELNIHERVKFHGWLDREKLPEFYAGSTVLALPSKYEGMSNVLLEAMAARLPCVVTDVEGTLELIHDDKTGLVVPVDDIDSLSQAIDRLLRDSTLRERLGRDAFAHVATNFSWDTSAQLHLNIFENKTVEKATDENPGIRKPPGSHSFPK